jgi:hypothetical protein
MALLSACFGAVALLLTAMGLYGVIGSGAWTDAGNGHPPGAGREWRQCPLAGRA